MAKPDEVTRKRRDEPPPIEWIRPEEAQAQAPPSSAQQPPAAWVPRPEEFQAPPWGPPPARPRAGRARIAGILMILAGLAAATTSVAVFLTPPTPEEIAVLQNFTERDMAVNTALVHIALWAQALSVLGGILAVQRKNWGLTVACALVALGNIVLTFLGFFLGLVGLILLLTARAEFSS